MSATDAAQSWSASTRVRGGIRTPGHGFDPTGFRVELSRTSTFTAAHAYPFLAQPGLTDEGTYIGQNLKSGAAFSFDPWVLYRAGIITNPNVVFAGDVGTGKTNGIAALTLRSLPFGRRVAAIDIKPDWTRFARAYGGQALSLGPTSSVVLNPLDITPYLEYSGPERFNDNGEVIDPLTTALTQQQGLLRALVELVLGRQLDAARFEGSALIAALNQANEVCHHRPILSDVLDALNNPQREVWNELNITKDEYLHAATGARGALHELLMGATGRMFNGQSTVTFDRDKRVVAMDLYELINDDVNLPRAYTCGAAWMEAALFNSPGVRWWNVYDEAAILFQRAGTSAIGRLQTNFRLARALGISNIIGLHNFSDAAAVGDDASAAAKQAKQLAGLAGTAVIGKTKTEELDLTVASVGLNDTQRDIINNADRGEFLFRIDSTRGALAYQVQIMLHPLERDLWNTTQAMVGADDRGAA